MTLLLTACASAPAKTILLGEHAVVYGRPALAAPVSGRRARAIVSPAEPGHGITIYARDLDRCYPGAGGCVDGDGQFLQAALRIGLCALGCRSEDLDLSIEIRSEIPVARGLGSGAAVSAALMRALACSMKMEIDPALLSSLVYETEKLLHGSPSGIDNTTVAYERPVWFRPGESPEVIEVGAPVTLLIGDTGVPSRTRESVAMVRARRECDPATTDACFDAIGCLVARARAALEQGDLPLLGSLMIENHAILASLGVSSGDLDRLVSEAMAAGALGAKLSGGGMGGCMVALAQPGRTEGIIQALLKGGAVQVIRSHIGGTGQQTSGASQVQGGQHA